MDGGGATNNPNHQWVETPTTYEWYHSKPAQWVVGNTIMSGGWMVSDHLFSPLGGGSIIMLYQ
jgi:hypothetical protein